MKVKNVMTKDVGFCHQDDTLAKAVGIMWQFDCGSVPALDKQNRVAGMITDRDICIASTTRNRLPSDILIHEVINGKLLSCRSDSSVEAALKIMGKNQVNRLPVVNKKRELLGILSVADLLLKVRKKRLRKKILKTITSIVTPSPILLKEM